MIYPFEQVPVFVLFILYAWTLFWKGIAMWKAARHSQSSWFIVFLLPINTAGILEIVYLFFFAKSKLKIDDLKFWEIAKGLTIFKKRNK